MKSRLRCGGPYRGVLSRACVIAPRILTSTWDNAFGPRAGGAISVLAGHRQAEEADDA